MPSTSKSDGHVSPGGIRGVIAGGIEICITYPTEFVKTQLQLDEGSSIRGGARQYDGVIDCVKKILRSRGFFGFYRGLSVLLYGSIPKSAVRWWVSRSHLCGHTNGNSESEIYQRSANPQYRGFFHGVRKIIQTEGLRGTYQGLSATMLKQGSNQAIRFYVMGALKDHYRKYENTLDCAIQIMRNEGPLAFYNSTIPRLGRVCADVAITFMIYDKFIEAFNVIWPQKQ